MPRVARASNETRALLFRHRDSLELVAQGVAVLVVSLGYIAFFVRRLMLKKSDRGTQGIIF